MSDEKKPPRGNRIVSTLISVKSNKVQCHIHGMISMEKVLTVNAKDVE